jgi:hypothetical protein
MQKVTKVKGLEAHRPSNTPTRNLASCSDRERSAGPFRNGCSSQLCGMVRPELPSLQRPYDAPEPALNDLLQVV